MDGGRRLGQSVSGFGKAAGLWADYRASRAANRRAAPSFTIRRGIGSSFALLFLGACGISGLIVGGHYEQFRRDQGSLHDGLARAFGFGVNHVGVSGNVELTADEVVALAGLNPQVSIPFLDPKQLQAQLVKVPLIAEASVAKLYPDRLKITIREREPYALWQRDGQVHVIAVDGTPIEELSDPRFLRLPHVVGTGANLRVKDFVALIESAPELAGLVRAGTLVSERRWTLKLQNGVDVKLPEEGAESALRRFVEVERQASLSGRAVLSIDMRVPDRVIVRLTEEAAAQHADTMAARIKKIGGRV